jgi:hypothetical protein
LVNSSTLSAFAVALRLIGRVVVLLGASPLIAVAAAEPPSLCQELAAQVRQAAPAATASVLITGVVTAQPEEPDRWGPSEIAVNARLRQVLETKGLLSETGPGSIMELEHLPDTPLYIGSVVAGTAECQTVAFAALSSDGLERVLPEPAGYTGACWNLTGSLAKVLGHPAYVESGTVSSSSADAVVRVTPWTGHDWGGPCQLTVEFNYTLKLAQQFCSDAAPCRAAGAIALDIARGYVTYSAMRQWPMRPIDDDVVPDFIGAAGIAGGPQAQAVVNAGWHVLKRRQQADIPGVSPLVGTMASAFPTFGHEAPNGAWDYAFSYVNFALLPLMLNGRLYLGAVGHNGVGWREGSNILFAVYAAPGADQDDLVPLAGFLIERKPSVLKGTVVAEGGSAVPARP